MKKHNSLAIIILLLLAISAPLSAQQTAATNASTLKEWSAGKCVSMQVINIYGIENCFAQSSINDVIFRRINGKSYKKNCTIPRSELRYLRVLHYTIDGKIMTGELICHKDIADDLIDIFRKLYDAKYPIESIRLIDDFGADDSRSMNSNNTSCFNFRFVSGTNKLSNHSRGKAIDINPLYNPYVKNLRNGTQRVDPQKGKPYADRNKKFKYKINHNDLAYKLFTSHGFEWGGNWKSLKDYQHFEKH